MIVAPKILLVSPPPPHVTPTKVVETFLSQFTTEMKTVVPFLEIVHIKFSVFIKKKQALEADWLVLWLLWTAKNISTATIFNNQALL